ncbi:ATP-dependent HslUV protease ATP-binding subunit HslU [Treponema bryantii]|uniref:ATP-dependent protease ATPase subunit HslU n=1 Tax=Treponema bryantii TaxID=163 RepID=A0A1I3M2F8_9SPIR|nr:ATP-dependent protease ATPase subunit HslU [Treponema bryantii]SFI91143.1 ATP-dependent HslUV protease ATP-binding subunit HslU [Treponema bryantii]
MENIENKTELTPKQIVEKLDGYIIGQEKAKRAVAVALRNRFRRLKLPEEIRDEVAPKNILMIGPTGCGKTEIARRLAKLCGAPFLKVEATKYTEVGYVGRDVESMIRDLMAVGYNDVKAEMEDQLREKSVSVVEERLLDLLLPGTGKGDKKKADGEGDKSEVKPLGFLSQPSANEITIDLNKVAADMQSALNAANQAAAEQQKADEESAEKAVENHTREKFRQMLREGKLEDREVDMVVHRPQGMPNMEIIAGGSIDDLQNSMQGILNMMNGQGRGKKRSVTVKEARKILTEEVLDNMVDHDKVADEAKKRVEQSGIIFIDEIDKIAVHGESHGQDVSREGVQRDILPIVEGSNVNTKFGVIDTTHILFIAAGAFSVAAPSDLIPELQGRFPLRVELDSLHKEDFKRILSEPKNSLIMQYTSLLETEGVKLDITEDALDRMSVVAEEVNSSAENIGARRLHTIMEKVLADINFEADEHAGETIKIDAAYVDSKLEGISQNQDLSRYIL